MAVGEHISVQISWGKSEHSSKTKQQPLLKPVLGSHSQHGWYLTQYLVTGKILSVNCTQIHRCYCRKGVGSCCQVDYTVSVTCCSGLCLGCFAGGMSTSVMGAVSPTILCISSKTRSKGEWSSKRVPNASKTHQMRLWTSCLVFRRCFWVPGALAFRNT